MSVIVLVTLITVVIVFLSLCCSWWRSQLWLLAYQHVHQLIMFGMLSIVLMLVNMMYSMHYWQFLPITININIAKTTSQFIAWNWACPCRNLWDQWVHLMTQKLLEMLGQNGKLLRTVWKMMAPGYPSLKTGQRSQNYAELCRVQRWWLPSVLHPLLDDNSSGPSYVIGWNMLKPQTRSKARNTRCCGTRQSCAIRILKERVHNSLITSPKPISWGEKTTTMRFLVDLPYLLMTWSCHDWQMMSLGIRDPIQCHPQDQ